MLIVEASGFAAAMREAFFASKAEGDSSQEVCESCSIVSFPREIMK